MLELLSTGIMGGFTGLIGTAFSAWNQRKLKELELKDKVNDRLHEVSMVKAESEAMRAEADANIRITESQVSGAVQLAESRAFEVSQRVGNVKTFSADMMDRLFATTGWLKVLAVPAGVLLAMLFGFADFVKSMARPTITGYLLGISTWVTWRAWGLMDGLGQSVTPDVAAGIVTDAINIVLYLTVTAVTWWFGDRMAAKGMARNLNVKGA